jgi:hypothetical protein
MPCSNVWQARPGADGRGDRRGDRYRVRGGLLEQALRPTGPDAARLSIGAVDVKHLGCRHLANKAVLALNYRGQERFDGGRRDGGRSAETLADPESEVEPDELGACFPASSIDVPSGIHRAVHSRCLVLSAEMVHGRQ